MRTRPLQVLYKVHMVLTSTRAIAKRFGAGAALYSVAYRMAQRLLVLDVEHLLLLESPSPARSSTKLTDVRVKSLTPEEVKRFAADPESDLDVAMLERILLENNYCFAALHAGELAGYAWFALDSIPPEHNRGGHPATGVGLNYPQHMAYMYKGYVRPNYRGNNLYGLIISEALAQLADVGVTQLLSNVECTNFAAQKSCFDVGYRSLGYVWRIGYPWKMMTIPPSSACQLGISFPAA